MSLTTGDANVLRVVLAILNGVVITKYNYIKTDQFILISITSHTAKVRLSGGQL